MVERQAGDLEVRGSNPGPDLNFPLEFEKQVHANISWHCDISPVTSQMFEKVSRSLRRDLMQNDDIREELRMYKTEGELQT